MTSFPKCPECGAEEYCSMSRHLQNSHQFDYTGNGGYGRMIDLLFEAIAKMESKLNDLEDDIDELKEQ